MQLATAGVVEMKSIAERVLDLKRISFNQESRLMTNKRCELPDKSWRAQKKGYEEVHVRSVRARSARIPIISLFHVSIT
jgi:pre-mRNA-splicing helicase BRR2